MSVDITGFNRMRREQHAKAESSLDDMSFSELRALAKVRGINDYQKLKKQGLIEALRG